jgi:hypothetical protein
VWSFHSSGGKSFQRRDRNIYAILHYQPTKQLHILSRMSLSLNIDWLTSLTQQTYQFTFTIIQLFK